MSSQGYWKTHDYKRRNVEEIESFIGWPYLVSMVEGSKNARDKALISALFLTGGRVSEVLSILRSMLRVNDPYIIVRSIKVLKGFKKTGEYIDEAGKKRWITEPVIRYRTFPIHKKEPLVPYLVDYVNGLEREQIFRIGRTRVYQIVRARDPDFWPHRFRSERASQLSFEYGYNTQDLVNFFNWKDLNTAIRYARMGWKGLATKMVR